MAPASTRHRFGKEREREKRDHRGEDTRGGVRNEHAASRRQRPDLRDACP